MHRALASGGITEKLAHRRLLLIVADGVRPDMLNRVIDDGDAPTLARLREKGGCHTITSSFPSVTGPAYVPFLSGRHPARAGLPGLRWFDRTRSLPWSIASTRSYVGMDIWRIDDDLDPATPTLLELARPSLSAMSILSRGASHGKIGRSFKWMIRGSIPHFLGRPAGWRKVESLATQNFFTQFARVRPRFSVLAITSPDKFAHRFGAFDQHVRQSIISIDRAAENALAIAQKDQWEEQLSVWVVGDHGHESINWHDDLHGWLECSHRVLAHPQLMVRNADIALMVSGNAVAHVYLDPAKRKRLWWPSLEHRWLPLLNELIARESVDLAIVGESQHTVRVYNKHRGSARVAHQAVDSFAEEQWSYIPIDGGDPLELGGEHSKLNPFDAWEVTKHSAYPDSLVQLSLLIHAERSGDIILSASHGWDFRARFEPTPHVSTHGALLSEQMHTVLLLDQKPIRQPQRTTDVALSALDLLGIDQPPATEGRSFLKY